MTFDDGIYPDFVKARVNCVVTALGEQFFKDKTMLEVGCGYGYAGELFEKLGANVTSLDARSEHIEIVEERYPHRKTVVADLEKDKIDGHYDIVLSFGLLYHLENPMHFIGEATRVCDNLIIETVVYDRNIVTSIVLNTDTTFDQGLYVQARIVSAKWLYEVMAKFGFDCKDISSAEANVPGNRFDWLPKNNGDTSRDGYYLRKMFYATKR